MDYIESSDFICMGDCTECIKAEVNEEGTLSCTDGDVMREVSDNALEEYFLMREEDLYLDIRW
jgi:hypothetical protein